MLILYIIGETHSLKSTPNDRFVEKLFMAILFTSQSFFQKSAERKSPKKYFLYVILMSGMGSNHGFTSNRPIHNLLDYAGFLLQYSFKSFPRYCVYAQRSVTNYDHQKVPNLNSRYF